MQLVYRLAADLIVLVHTAYVAFVVIGFALILIGIARRWDWVRNVWYRWIHLAAILVVVSEDLLEFICPLTVWEQRLRALAGQTSYRGSFIANWVHEGLFIDSAPPWAFTLAYSLFGLAVLATIVLAPPRRSSRSAATSTG